MIPTPQLVRFAARREYVYQGSRLIARAVSGTMAQRIAHALNKYQPGPKGK